MTKELALNTIAQFRCKDNAEHEGGPVRSRIEFAAHPAPESLEVVGAFREILKADPRATLTEGQGPPTGQEREAQRMLAAMGASSSAGSA